MDRGLGINEGGGGQIEIHGGGGGVDLMVLYFVCCGVVSWVGGGKACLLNKEIIVQTCYDCSNPIKTQVYVQSNHPP